jgi:hypothetical protein
MFKPGNLSLSSLRKVLVHENCKKIRTSSGHEIWCRNDLLRPITFQTHIDPVPEFIVLQIMRTLSLSRKEMEKILNK